MRDRNLESDGNAVYLVLHAGGTGLLNERYLSALSLFGIPFRVRKAEAGVDWESEFRRCSGVLLADNGCLARLGSRGISSLAAVIEKGWGLISFDCAFSRMDAHSLELLGVDDFTGSHSVSEIRTTTAEHPLTALRQLSDSVILDRPLETVRIRSRRNVLLESDSGVPLCFVGENRKVVTFSLSDELWSLDACGHCAMMDDIFYRSIIWSARKPFISFRLPMLVSAIVDDCSGSYNHFAYVDTMNKFGWKPHLALFFAGVDEVAHDTLGLDGRKIRSLFEDQLAEFGPHAIRYNELFGFDHLGRRCLSDKQVAENFEYHDRRIEEWGIRPSRLAHMHFGEVGSNSLPFLEERGYEFFTRLLPMNASWFDVPGETPHLPPQWPYGHDSYNFSVMPENPHFFQPLAVAGNKSRASTDFPVRADYLWDRTVFWGENEGIDIEGAADTLVFQIRQATSSGFYGMASTHEQRIAVMHPWQWEELWSRVADGLSACELKYCLLEEAMAAARDLFHSGIASLSRRDDRLECVLRGDARESVELQVFADDLSDSLEPEILEVAAFENGCTVEV